MISPPDDRRRAIAAIRAGVAVFVVSLTVMLLPLLIGRTALNKYLVAFGLIGAMLGLGWLTNGAIDLFRARGR
jgi:hypothetical protein